MRAFGLVDSHVIAAFLQLCGKEVRIVDVWIMNSASQKELYPFDIGLVVEHARVLLLKRGELI